jgi:hypothetical protein
MAFDIGRGEAASIRAAGRSVTVFDAIVRSRMPLLAAALIAALTLGAPSQALAACGTLATGGGGGTHAPSTSGGSVHSGATAPHGSTGTGSCPSGTTGNGVKTATLGAGTLAGVHPATGNTGNGKAKTSSGTRTHVASAVTRTHVRRP